MIFAPDDFYGDSGLVSRLNLNGNDIVRAGGIFLMRKYWIEKYGVWCASDIGMGLFAAQTDLTRLVENSNNHRSPPSCAQCYIAIYQISLIDENTFDQL